MEINFLKKIVMNKLLTIIKKSGIIMAEKEKNVEKTKKCIKNIEHLIHEYEESSSEKVVKNFNKLLNDLKLDLDNKAGDK